MRTGARTLFLCAPLVGWLVQCGDPEVTQGGSDASTGGGPFGSGGSDSSGGSGGGAGAPPAPDHAELAFTPVSLPGAGSTTDFAFVPGRPDEFVVTDQSGKLFHYQLTSTGVTELGHVEVPDTHYMDGCGLLNVLFDPDFEDNGFMYLSRCIEPTVNRLSRFEFDDLAELPDSEAEILTIADDRIEYPWHRFGSMGFEEDGETLWVLLGDLVVDGVAQDIRDAAGSLLRILPNREAGGSGYTPAAGNAFEEVDGDPNIYAYGFRSPWRGTRDRFGRFWVGDVGNVKAEEVNLVLDVGENFGWGLAEGPCESDCDELSDPLTYYGRESDERYVLEDPLTEPATKRAIWVGQAYHATQDRYFGLFGDAVMFGDFFTGWVRRLEVDSDGELVSDESVGHLKNVTSWKTGLDGYMYALTIDAHLHRATQVIE